MSNVSELPTQLAKKPAFDPQAFWPKNWEEGLRYAGILAKAPSLLPKHILQAKDPAAEIFAHIMYGFEVGLAPLQSLRAIYIVHGRAGMYAADQIALIQARPDCEKLEVTETTDRACTWVTKRRGRTEQKLRFTIEEAEREGLLQQNAKYRTAPAVMLRWRCATRLLAFTWGDVLRGMEDREHIEAEVVDGGWMERVTAPPPRPTPTASAPPAQPDTKTEPTATSTVELQAGVTPAEDGPTPSPASAGGPDSDEDPETSLIRRMDGAADINELMSLAREVKNAPEDVQLRLTAVYQRNKERLRPKGGAS